MQFALVYICGLIMGCCIHSIWTKRKSVGVIKKSVNDEDGEYLFINFYEPLENSLHGKRFVTMEVDLSQK